MNLSYFAHEGVQHASTVEAAVHEDGRNLFVTLTITAVIALAVAGVVFFLNKAGADKPGEDD